MSLSVSPVRLPRLLDANDTDHPFSEITRLHPSRLSVSIKRTPLSSADMELTGEDVPVRSFAELYTIHGSAGIYRAAQVETDYADDSSRVAWEHGICTLGDVIYTEKEEQSKTVTDMLNTLLGLQGERAYWAVGRVETGDTVTLTPNGQTVLDLLLTMMEQLPDYMLSFDQSSFPWLLSIVRKPQEITAEGRLSRNLSSVRVQYDDSELCTRVYANGLGNGYMDSDNVATYGLVEHSLTLSEDIERAEAETIASRYLEKRDTPAVAIEIDAVDLSLATGEALDAFTISKRFRLALPAYGQTFEEDIIGIEYADVYGEPERVTLELANEIADINEKSRKAQKVAAAIGGVSGVAATQNTIIKQDTKMETYDKYITALEDEDILVMREDHTKVEVNKAIAEITAVQTDIYEETSKTDIMKAIRQAGITVDANMGLVSLLATEAIERKDTTNAQQTKIEQNTANISINADAITSKVSKGNVVSEINQTADNVQILASKIHLEGYVTASQLESYVSTIGSSRIRQLVVGAVNGSSGSFTIESGSSVRMLGKSPEWRKITPYTMASFTYNPIKMTLKDSLGGDVSVIAWAGAGRNASDIKIKDTKDDPFYVWAAD